MNAVHRIVGGERVPSARQFHPIQMISRGQGTVGLIRGHRPCSGTGKQIRLVRRVLRNRFFRTWVKCLANHYARLRSVGAGADNSSNDASIPREWLINEIEDV